jgi:ABC-type branched-subunit amino acid transport system substrate-binding protein
LLFTFGALVFAGNTIYLNQKQVQLNIRLSKEKKDLYDQYAYCPKEKGRPGERVEETDTCFRALRTNGNLPVFLSKTNDKLYQGTQAFKERKYESAKLLFNEASMAEPDDPVSKIFFNNASARQFAQDYSHKSTVKLAVVTSVDYFETGAKEVLTGVAHAQDEFNCYNKRKIKCYDIPNIEIEINNDENEPEAAEKVANILVNDREIQGVIGHYASESTRFAQEHVYSKNDMPVISPTSSSSRIVGSQFFRAVGSTKKGAKSYVDYLLKNNINDPRMLVVFFKRGPEYSEALTKDLIAEFKEKTKSNGITPIDIGSFENENIDSTNKRIDNEINNIFKKTPKIRAIFVITDVKTNSTAVSIMKKIKTHKNYKESIKIFGAMSLLEKEVLKNRDKSIEGMIMARPYTSKFKFGSWKNNNNLPQPDSEMDWRTATSYDSTKAFGKAIQLSRNDESRKGILSRLSSPLFQLTEKEASGIKLKWELSGDRSNERRTYCLVQVLNGRFVPLQSVLLDKAQCVQPQ